MLSRKVGRLILRTVVDKELVAILLGPSSHVNEPLAITAPPAHIAVLMIMLPFYWIPESYCRQHWTVVKGDLSEIIASSRSSTNLPYILYLRFLKWLPSIRHLMKQKFLTKHFSRMARKHYEIEASIYQLFLDQELVYTCAFFEDGDDLKRAQQRKFDTILSRLSLDENANSILNIGTGWASLERHLVRRTSNVLATGLSIAKGQIEWANEHNGLVLEPSENRRISLLHEDYVNHHPSSLYDGITVIGMIEHVGLSGYHEFFEKCAALLKPGSRMVIHTIVDAKDNEKTASWLDAKIFPGGYIPSVSELTKAAQGSPLILRNVFLHDAINYKRTLECWAVRLKQNRDEMLEAYVTRHGYSIEFAGYLFRQWEVYLAASKLAFHGGPGTSQVAHIVFEKC